MILIFYSYPYSEDGAHDVSGGAPQPLAVAVEGLEVGLVERVADDLDVQFVQVLLAHTLAKKLGCKQHIFQWNQSISIVLFCFDI